MNRTRFLFEDDQKIEFLLDQVPLVGDRVELGDRCLRVWRRHLYVREVPVRFDLYCETERVCASGNERS